MIVCFHIFKCNITSEPFLALFYVVDSILILGLNIPLCFKITSNNIKSDCAHFRDYSHNKT